MTARQPLQQNGSAQQSQEAGDKTLGMSTLRGIITSLLATLAVLTAAAPATAATRTGAQRAARAAANRYTDSHFGISGRTTDWKAACLGMFGGRWICALVFNGGQCAGSLVLSSGLHARGVRIGCGE